MALISALRKAQQTQNEREFREFANVAAQTAREWKFPRLAGVIDRGAASMDAPKDSDIDFEKMPTTSPEPWWDRRFLDWYAASIAPLAKDFGHDFKPIGPACQTLLNSMAQRFARDRSGRRRIFAPGVALALYLSRIAHQEIDPNWKLMYKEAVGADPPTESATSKQRRPVSRIPAADKKGARGVTSAPLQR